MSDPISQKCKSFCHWDFNFVSILKIFSVVKYVSILNVHRILIIFQSSRFNGCLALVHFHFLIAQHLPPPSEGGFIIIIICRSFFCICFTSVHLKVFSSCKVNIICQPNFLLKEPGHIYQVGDDMPRHNIVWFKKSVSDTQMFQSTDNIQWQIVCDTQMYQSSDNCCRPHLFDPDRFLSPEGRFNILSNLMIDDDLWLFSPNEVPTSIIIYEHQGFWSTKMFFHLVSVSAIALVRTILPRFRWSIFFISF